MNPDLFCVGIYRIIIGEGSLNTRGATAWCALMGTRRNILGSFILASR